MNIYTLCSSSAFNVLPNPQGVGPTSLMTRLNSQGSVPAERQKQIIRIFKWAGFKTLTDLVCLENKKAVLNFC